MGTMRKRYNVQYIQEHAHEAILHDVAVVVSLLESARLALYTSLVFGLSGMAPRCMHGSCFSNLIMPASSNGNDIKTKAERSFDLE